jgi:orotidine-5'-phosphate decarboxylase
MGIASEQGPEPAAESEQGQVSVPFGLRLHAALEARGPLCVGVDPHPALLAGWGLPDDVDGLARFAAGVVEAVAGEVAVLKPQSAFFERHGSAGIAVLERTISTARAAGALVLLDAKRGDIGSTVQAYADAYLRPGAPLAADALTVNPYLGFGSLRPFLDVAAATGAGVFVLALTSNPEGGQVQRAVTESGRTVAGALLADIAAENAAEHAAAASGAPFGSVGAVVGATVADAGEDLDCGGPLLAPGVGAQGGTAADVRRLFAGVADRVVPVVARDVLAAGPDTAGMREAALRWRDRMAEALMA